MVFSRFVEIGRLVLVVRGSEAGKVAVIVDVLDANRVLIDGPTTNVKRQVANLKSLALTELRIEIPHSIKTGPLTAKLAKQDIVSQWNQSTWAKKIAARKQKYSTSDFDRFKMRVEKRKNNFKVGSQVSKLRKQQVKK